MYIRCICGVFNECGVKIEQGSEEGGCGRGGGVVLSTWNAFLHVYTCTLAVELKENCITVHRVDGRGGRRERGCTYNNLLNNESRLTTHVYVFIKAEWLK